MNTNLDKYSLVFAGKSSDDLALRGLRRLDKLGFATAVLGPDDFAPIGSVVFYTVKEWPWTAHNIRVAAHRLYPNRPNWAITTPFLVEIKAGARGNVEHAFETLALDYRNWFRGGAGTQVPWETRNGQQTHYKNELEQWMDLVADTIGEEAFLDILSATENREKIRGRGGDIVYFRLGDSGRVVLCKDDLPAPYGKTLNGSPKFGTNKVYREIAGYTDPVVSYGTSDAANLFELLQALKLGQHLGLPVVFETYPSAHNWGYWRNGFLVPSLAVLGVHRPIVEGSIPDEFGFRADYKYATLLTAEMVRKRFPMLGLEHIVELAASWADVPLWVFYQRVMQCVANEMLELLNLKPNYTLTTFEKISESMGLSNMRIKFLAEDLERKTGHSVVALNLATGRQLQTSDFMPQLTVKEAHEQGSWLGGAALYDAVFSLGRFGGIVVMVKDSTAGRVNLIAREYLDETSGLHLAPVGLFRLTADGQNEDWSIDPLVMLELLRRWGPDQARFEVRKIWDAMEVPLERKHIGRKTICTVSQGGVVTKVVDI